MVVGAEYSLETGVVEATTSSELRTQALFRDRLVGVVRARHPLAKRKVTAARYAAGEHVTVSRRTLERRFADWSGAPA